MIRIRRQRALRVLKGIAVALASVFFVAAIVVLWGLESGRAHPYVKKELTEQLRTSCDLELGLESMKLVTFPPEIHLSQVRLASVGTNKTLLAVESVQAGVAVLPLFYGRIQLVRVELLRPTASLTLENGSIKNLPKCLSSSPSPTGPKDSGQLAVGIDDLDVELGSFHFEDLGKLSANVADLDFRLSKARSGGAAMTLGIPKISIDTGTTSFDVNDLRVAAHIAGPLTRPRAISVQSASVEALGATLAVEGSIDFVGPVAEARLKAAAPLGLVNQLVKNAPPLTGTVKLSASFAGDLDNPRMAGRLSLDHAKIDVYALADTMDIDFVANRSLLEVTHLLARYGPGEVTAKAKIKLDDHFSLEGTTQWTETSLGRFIESLGLDGPWVDYRGTGPVTVSGTLDPVRIAASADLELREFRVYDRPFDRPELRRKPAPDQIFLAVDKAHVKADGVIEANGVAVDRAVITTPSSQCVATGHFDFRQKVGMHIEGALSPFDFEDVGGAIATVPFSGAGRLSVTVSGPYDHLGGRGTFDLSGVTISSIPFGNGRGTMTWEGTALHFESIDGKLGSSKYAGDVHVELARGAELTIDGEILDGRVEDLLLPFDIDGRDVGEPHGKVRGRMTLLGPARALTGPVNLELDEVTVVDESGFRGNLDARLEAGTIILDQANFEKRGARILGRLNYNPGNGELSLRARSESAPLTAIDALRRSTDQIAGTLDVDLGIERHGSSATGTLAVGLADLHAFGLDLKGGQLFGRIANGHVDFVGAILPNDELSFEGRTELAGGLPYSARFSLSKYNLPKLVAAMSNSSESNREISGSAVARGTFRGSLTSWQDSVGTIELERGELTIGTTKADASAGGTLIETAAPSSFKLASRTLETQRMTLLGPGSKLTLRGVIGGGRTSLAVDGRIDLVVASTLFAPVEDSAGSLALEALIRGRDDGYDLVGSGRLERASLEWRNLPGRLSGASADVTFSQSTILIEGINGRYEGGRVGGSGQVILDGSSLGALTLELLVDKVHPEFVYPTFDLGGTISGALTLEGSLEHLTLRGDISVDRGVVRPKFEWSDLVAQAQNRLLPKVYDPASEILDLDVGVTPENPVRLVNGDIANLELRGDVRLVGTNQRMGLIGTMNALPGGRVGFLSREYSILGGTVDFRDRDRFFPRYDVDLSAVACAHEISLNLVGTLDGNVINYSSKPEMSQSDIVACLFGGARIKDLENAGDEAAASIAGQLLVEVTGVEKQVKRLIPVDQIELTSEYSPRERLYEPRLLVAKEILDGRVRLEYSSSLVRQDDQRAAMRYRVSPELTLKGGWTSSEEIPIGDVGVDMTYRWEF
ncbi:MAG: translocation/assembly module TamB domain-containing protein [Deltaproteobacteria bacterium]|nr:translocation/assembly module TamB domain-containing protein [Deltaproteobacteria bacterium]